jgi:hypothetical protein
MCPDIKSPLYTKSWHISVRGWHRRGHVIMPKKMSETRHGFLIWIFKVGGKEDDPITT